MHRGLSNHSGFLCVHTSKHLYTPRDYSLFDLSVIRLDVVEFRNICQYSLVCDGASWCWAESKSICWYWVMFGGLW